MSITLKKVTRENWLEAIALKIEESQVHFTPSVAVSLAKVYIKPDGEGVMYLPFAIYDDETMVGFIMHAYEENTDHQYWINGFLIDKRYQRKRYGTAALKLMITYIKETQHRCKLIKLSVHRDNKNAYELYKKHGFCESGQWIGEELVLTRNVELEP